MTKRKTLARLTLSLLLPLMAAGCGGVTSSQQVARDKATDATCDRYQECNQIGPGLMYTNRSLCEGDVRAGWENGWPAAECDGKINQAQLEVCLSRIRATECNNGLDVLATLAISCPKEKICNPTANPDAAP
jgi:hypothetical protein